MQLAEANVLITGGARGIGNFIALNLLQQAASVFVIDNNAELLREMSEHPRLKKFNCDVTQPADVEKVIGEIFEDHGGVNVCINNAGIIHSELLINFLSKAEKKHNFVNWKNVIDVNLNAVFYITANVVERMIVSKKKGVIINISSISANGNVGQSAYAASKAAVEALTKTWSKELGMFKIRCACIAPGFFNTPSTKDSVNDHMLKKWEKSTPLNRLGELQELLSAVVFIIQNDFFNGKILPLDGGLTI